MTLFLDTYALIEILKGNPRFDEFSHAGRTSLLNLLELHIRLAREFGDEMADSNFGRLRHLALEPTDAEILAASRIRRHHPKKDLSLPDALGYAMARSRALEFVTGDPSFRDMPGVIFRTA